MHYKNGRTAKAGDKIVDLGNGLTGILHSTVAGGTTCNGRLALTTPSDPWVTVGQCLHLDDVAAADVPIKQ